MVPLITSIYRVHLVCGKSTVPRYITPETLISLPCSHYAHTKTMNRNSSAGSLPQRPLAFSTKSFTRFEPPSSAVPSAHRHRASTLSTPVLPRKSPEEERKDIFNKVEIQDDEPVSADLSRTSSLPDKFDELPIELASLTDR